MLERIISYSHSRTKRLVRFGSLKTPADSVVHLLQIGFIRFCIIPVVCTQFFLLLPAEEAWFHLCVDPAHLPMGSDPKKLWALTLRKKIRYIWIIYIENAIFAAHSKECRPETSQVPCKSLDYGVMVALQVLVLSDWVRVPVVQRFSSSHLLTFISF